MSPKILQKSLKYTHDAIIVFAPCSRSGVPGGQPCDRCDTRERFYENFVDWTCERLKQLMLLVVKNILRYTNKPVSHVINLNTRDELTFIFTK